MPVRGIGEYLTLGRLTVSMCAPVLVDGSEVGPSEPVPSRKWPGAGRQIAPGIAPRQPVTEDPSH